MKMSGNKPLPPTYEKGFVMPKAVKLGKGKEFVFKAATKGGGKESKFAWDEWFNGDLLLLEQSQGDKDDKGNVVKVTHKRDYEPSTDQMPGKIKSAARRKYKVVQISRLDADGKKLVDSIIIKARDMTPDERVAEDLLRAEEKEKNAQRRAEAKAAEANGQATGPVAAPA